MKLYNTMTKQYEELLPLDGDTIRMYTCGPTVYDFFHVGNARCFVVFDFLVKKFYEDRANLPDEILRKKASLPSPLQLKRLALLFLVNQTLNLLLKNFFRTDH